MQSAYTRYVPSPPEVQTLYSAAMRAYLDRIAAGASSEADDRLTDGALGAAAWCHLGYAYDPDRLVARAEPAPPEWPFATADWRPSDETLDSVVTAMGYLIAEGVRLMRAEEASRRRPPQGVDRLDRGIEDGESGHARGLRGAALLEERQQPVAGSHGGPVGNAGRDVLHGDGEQQQRGADRVERFPGLGVLAFHVYDPSRGRWRRETGAAPVLATGFLASASRMTAGDLVAAVATAGLFMLIALTCMGLAG